MASPDKAAPAGGARQMGKTGLTVSRLGYGAMELSGPPRARDIAEIDVINFLNRIVDLGINYIDTSIDYGLSESLIGKALSHRREEYFLASKCACAAGLAANSHEHEKHIYTAANVIAGIEQSLRRLKTDYLDVAQVHGNPTRKELEEGGVIDALIKLKAQGKVRHTGISSRLPLLAEFIDVECFTVVQVPYSALQRANEDAIAALREAGKAVVVRGVTGRGAPGKGWATRPIGTEVGEARALWERAKLDELLGGMSPIEFMIRFAMANDNVDVALVATTNADHLADDVKIAAKGPMDQALFDQVRARVTAAGSAPGQGIYNGGGPTPVL